MNYSLRSSLVMFTIAAIPLSALADEITDAETFLFVQHAESVRLADGTLTLENADKNMIIFADRPHRAAAVVLTSKLIEIWGEGQDSLADDPPNAALVGQSEGKPISMVVELTDPKHGDGSLTFSYTILEGAEVSSLEQSYMVIDSISFPFFKVDGLMNSGSFVTGDPSAIVNLGVDTGANAVGAAAGD